MVDLGGVRMGVLGAILEGGGGDDNCCFDAEEGMGLRFLLDGRLALAMGVLMEA